MGMNFTELFGGVCTALPKGDCRLAMNGLIAVNVNTGGKPQYKTYDIKSGVLTNCSDFAMELDGSFFVVPTMKVRPGDIILTASGPSCVIEAGKNSIRVFSYQRCTIEELVPERQLFMGNHYCYRKIFSPLAGIMSGGKGAKNMVKLMVLNQLFSGNENGSAQQKINPMMLMMLNGGGQNIIADMFDGAFDFNDEDEEREEE